MIFQKVKLPQKNQCNLKTDGLFEFNYQTYGNMPECLEIDVENPNGLNSFK